MSAGKTTRIVRVLGDSFLIGTAIEVKIHSVDGDHVTLECRAPGVLPVAGRETVDAIAAQNKKSALSRIPTVGDLCQLMGGEES